MNGVEPDQPLAISERRSWSGRWIPAASATTGTEIRARLP
jgi:hypothetical protein